MHCLEKPWGKAINFGWMIHPGPVAEELEEVKETLFNWCRLLIVSTMTDIYKYAVQMKKEEKVPKEDWLQIKANYEGLPTTPAGQEFRVDIKDLPASLTIGLGKRARTTKRTTRRQRKPAPDNQNYDFEFSASVPDF